uniref:Uncharacterized protein n=1 Tax=Arundo donax TaxID=35708 RepID=A0A0A9DYK9_ARUDO
MQGWIDGWLAPDERLDPVGSFSGSDLPVTVSTNLFRYFFRGRVGERATGCWIWWWSVRFTSRLLCLVRFCDAAASYSRLIMSKWWIKGFV